jgi:hypothetical protein
MPVSAGPADFLYTITNEMLVNYVYYINLEGLL